MANQTGTLLSWSIDSNDFECDAYKINSFSLIKSYRVMEGDYKLFSEEKSITREQFLSFKRCTLVSLADIENSKGILLNYLKGFDTAYCVACVFSICLVGLCLYCSINSNEKNAKREIGRLNVMESNIKIYTKRIEEKIKEI